MRESLNQMTPEGALDCIMRQWPQLDIFPEDGEDDSGHYIFSSREEALRHAKETLRRFKAMPDPIPVWRVVAADSEEDVDLDRGSSWSFTKQAALDFAADNGSNFVISGKVSKSFVNWCATIGLNVMSSDLMGVENEDEIRVDASYVDDKEVHDIDMLEEGKKNEPRPNVNLMVGNVAAVVEDGWKRVVQKIGRALGYKATGFKQGDRGQLVETKDLPGYKKVLKKLEGVDAYRFITTGPLDEQIIFCRIEFVEPDHDVVMPVYEASFIPWKTKVEGKDFMLDVFTLTIDPRAYWHHVVDDLRTDGKRLARHEARHSVERKLSGKPQGANNKTGTKQDYYDNPGEIRARSSEIDVEVEKLARNNPQLDFKTILDISQGWRRIRNAERSGVDMTKTKRYVIKAASKAYERGRQVNEMAIGPRSEHEYYYHATTVERARQIVKKGHIAPTAITGIKPWHDGDWTPRINRVYLSSDPSWAIEYAFEVIGAREEEDPKEVGLILVAAKDVPGIEPDEDDVAEVLMNLFIRSDDHKAWELAERISDKYIAGRPAREEVIRKASAQGYQGKGKIVRLSREILGEMKPEEDEYQALMDVAFRGAVKGNVPVAKGYVVNVDGVSPSRAYRDQKNLTLIKESTFTCFVTEVAKEVTNKKALVLVHVDSIGSYYEQVDRQLGRSLAEHWVKAVKEHVDRGDEVVIINQGWEVDNDAAAIFYRGVPKKGTGITWMEFDESESEWSPFLSKLTKMLKQRGVTDIELGGVWYSYNEDSGCATTVQNHLRSKGFKVNVEPHMVACEDELWPDEYDEDEDDEYEESAIHLTEKVDGLSTPSERLAFLKELEPTDLAGSKTHPAPSASEIKAAIEELSKNFQGCKTPREINSGQCDQFAEELIRKLRVGLAFETLETYEDDLDDGDEWDPRMEYVPAHAFVQIGDRYYDAEAPGGVRNWWDLPVYQRFVSERLFGEAVSSQPVPVRPHKDIPYPEENRYIAHITDHGSLSSIAKMGLVPKKFDPKRWPELSMHGWMETGTKDPLIFFGTDAYFTAHWGDRMKKPVMLRVPRSYADEKDGVNLYGSRPVPADEIQVYTNEGWKPIKDVDLKGYQTG